MHRGSGGGFGWQPPVGASSRAPPARPPPLRSSDGSGSGPPLPSPRAPSPPFAGSEAPRAPARSSRRRLCTMTPSNPAPPLPPAPLSPGPHLIGSARYAPPPAGQWAASYLHMQRAPARAARPGLRLNRRCSAGAWGASLRLWPRPRAGTRRRRRRRRRRSGRAESAAGGRPPSLGAAPGCVQGPEEVAPQAGAAPGSSQACVGRSPRGPR